MSKRHPTGAKGPHKVDTRLGDVDATRMNLDQIGTNPLSPTLDFDRMRRGRIEHGRRYLGNGAWQWVNTEEARLNERNEHP